MFCLKELGPALAPLLFVACANGAAAADASRFVTTRLCLTLLPEQGLTIKAVLSQASVTWHENER